MIKKCISVILGVAIIGGLVGCGNKNITKENDLSKTKNEIVNYNNGEYEGDGNGCNGKIKVNVKIDENKIKDINILSHTEDEEYFVDAKVLIPNIIEKQSVEVDTISGATKSSDGIIEAVKNALAKSK
ncbi:FMN-binding protein [Clostridium tarantellae]|uniref:FMN-binding protein n=1 Tax=Clostridium tarantellae TaxID=39493 RepID=A0A6I1MLP0_9CLOT|nr:FMN-binding protein [Clostridium tarantellae]MPQ43338.1 FMN-binding protein [Clostridium tarantellae]